jgi:hypothetical protein
LVLSQDHDILFNTKGGAVRSIVLLAVGIRIVSAQTQPAGSYRPDIPKAWDGEAVRTMELPLVGLGEAATHISAEEYYRLTVRKIYRSYPVYHPDREPKDYQEWLQNREPVIEFDVSKLKTQADWIKAGEQIFQGASDRAASAESNIVNSRRAERFQAAAIPVAADGSVPFWRYIIREKGKVELASGCAACHVRVLPDGTVVPGAQGNLPAGWIVGQNRRSRREREPDSLRQIRMRDFVRASVPWLRPDPAENLKQASWEEVIGSTEHRIAGLANRVGTNPNFAPKIPNLIGVKGRRHLDATGLIRHRSIGDLMRYAALVSGIDEFARYGAHRPVNDVPDQPAQRFSDEQLYALALYVYSLTPPPNPNKPSPESRRGQDIFVREGCAHCHTPPEYTNNEMIPVSVIKTDPKLAMATRKATGYYRVPSLRGVWYGGPFEHNGSMATLEDWFDRARLRDDYVPTGFVGYGVKMRPVRGHEFGLMLSPEDKKALIAFLRTL